MSTLALEKSKYRREKRGPGEIAQQLRLIRLSRRLTIEQVADIAGYSKSTISEWERGASRPPFEGICDWATALGYTVTLTPKA